jgi:hypothetical protein
VSRIVRPARSACANGELGSSGVRVRFRRMPPAGDDRRDGGREDTGVGVLRPLSFPGVPTVFGLFINHSQPNQERRVAARCSSRFLSQTARYLSYASRKERSTLLLKISSPRGLVVGGMGLSCALRFAPFRSDWAAAGEGGDVGRGKRNLNGDGGVIGWVRTFK